MTHLSYRPARRARELQAEMFNALGAADRLSPVAKRAFRDLVGHPGQRLDVGGVGLARIMVDRAAGRFDYAGDGPQALIFAARDWPHRAGGDLIDLVAWLPGDNEIFTRLGIADLLGSWHLGPMPELSIQVFSDPASWARSNAAGIVVIDWQRLWGVDLFRKIVVFDVETGKRLESALRPKSWRKSPKIYVAEASRAA